MNWYFNELMAHLIHYLMVDLFINYGTFGPPYLVAVGEEVLRSLR